MSYSYSKNSQFPYPVIPVTIYRSEGTVLTSTLLAQVDTGAEVTMVPAALLTLTESDLIHIVRLRSHWGEPRSVRLYQVDMTVGDERLSAVKIIADPYGTEILLGRNVLNRLILLFDGMKLQTDLFTHVTQSKKNRHKNTNDTEKTFAAQKA
jgi:predicted aspartyl protease